MTPIEEYHRWLIQQHRSYKEEGIKHVKSRCLRQEYRAMGEAFKIALDMYERLFVASEKFEKQ